jgi:hypothetical protein
MTVQILDSIAIVDAYFIRTDPYDFTELLMEIAQRNIRITLQCEPRKPCLPEIRNCHKPIRGGVLPQRMRELMLSKECNGNDCPDQGIAQDLGRQKTIDVIHFAGSLGRVSVFVAAPE